MDDLRRVETQHARAVALIESSLGRVDEAADAVLAVVAGHAVDEQVDGVALTRLIVFDADNLAVDLDAGKSLFQVDV